MSEKRISVLDALIIKLDYWGGWPWGVLVVEATQRGDVYFDGVILKGFLDLENISGGPNVTMHHAAYARHSSLPYYKKPR